MHIGGRDEQAIWIISFLWNICFKRSFCIHGKKYSYFNMPTECWIISVNIWRYTESKTPAVVPDFNWQVLSSSSSFSPRFFKLFQACYFKWNRRFPRNFYYYYSLSIYEHNMCVALRAVAAQNFVWFDVHKDSYSRKKNCTKTAKILKERIKCK